MGRTCWLVRVSVGEFLLEVCDGVAAVSPLALSVLEIFSFGPFGRAVALAAGASASTPNPLGFGMRGAGVEAVTIMRL